MTFDHSISGIHYSTSVGLLGMNGCRHAYSVSWVREYSAPELGELPGKGSALLVTRAGRGRTQ